MFSFKIFLITVIIEYLHICVMMLCRNKMIYDYRAKALDIIFARSDDAKELQRKYDSYGSYVHMLNNELTKWRFEDFYPDLDRGGRDYDKRYVEKYAN